MGLSDTSTRHPATLMAVRLKEILLDFNHFYDLTDEAHTRLLDMIIDIFGSKLCPVGKVNGVTLDVMWQKGYQVLAFYHNKSDDNSL